MADPIWELYARMVAWRSTKLPRYEGGYALTLVRTRARGRGVARRRGPGIYLLPVPETHDDAVASRAIPWIPRESHGVSARVMAGEPVTYLPQPWRTRRRPAGVS
jgi:hypothetical protein